MTAQARGKNIAADQRSEIAVRTYPQLCQCPHCLQRAAASDMLAALKAVEEWWLNEEMNRHTGAPYAIFATRAAIAKAEGR